MRFITFGRKQTSCPKTTTSSGCQITSSINSSSNSSNIFNGHSLPSFRSFQESLLILYPILLIILLDGVSCVVVYQVRFIATKTGRTDYALAGESIELSCHYIMKDEAEDVKQLIWSKDGKNFLRWRKNKPGLEVLSYTFKGHLDPSSKHSHITVHNVTIDMHGKYKCSVKTDLGTHEAEQDLVVISQSNCKLNDWRVTSQPTSCREMFRLDCRNMFPKPVPSCGLWNGKSDKFIRSVTVDISEEPNKQTYRVRYSDSFELQPQNDRVITHQTKQTNQINSDLIQYAGHLTFKCDIIVPETSWRLSLIHRMFDYDDGCLQDPLETIERVRLNYSHYATSRMQQAGYLMDKQVDEIEMLASGLKYELLPANMSRTSKIELNCWRKPRLGTLARLSCLTKANQVKLVGANLLECQRSGWVPISEASLKKSQTARGRRPTPRSSRKVVEGSSGIVTSLNTGLDQTIDLSGRHDENHHEEETTTEIEVLPSGSNDIEESTVLRQPTNGDSLSPTEVDQIIIPTTPEPDPQPELVYRPISVDDQRQATLSPSQLAALLPTCVSTRRHLKSSSPVSNRLPLLEGAIILESSANPANSRHSVANNQKNTDQQNSIFNFFSSSGSKSIQPITLIVLMSLFISIGLSVVNLQSFLVVQSQQNRCKR